MSQWFVYMLQCNDDSLYTGVTTDIERRVKEHNNDSKLGANYTRARRPVKLVYSEQCEDRSQALKREVGIKKLKRTEKQALINKLP